jgi:hypothetical protein
MPTRLIQPLEAGAAAATGPTWGVGTIRTDVSAFDGDVVAVLEAGRRIAIRLLSERPPVPRESPRRDRG